MGREGSESTVWFILPEMLSLSKCLFAEMKFRMWSGGQLE